MKVFSSPKDPSQFYILKGQFLNIEDGAYVQGSSSFGGLQPDYFIDLQDPSIKQVLVLSEEIGNQPDTFWNKVEKVSELVGLRTLKRKSYTDPGYLKIMESHRLQNQDIPLAAYIECGAGVCRENGMLLHLALKAARIPNNYVYADVSQSYREESKTEGHGFTVVFHEGKKYVVDSYNSNFNRTILDELLEAKGVMLRDGTHIKINQISTFPLVWNPKQKLKSIIGQGFIKAPYYSGPEMNAGELVEPNELHPEIALDLYRSGSQGVHFSVGSERGYIGFAMNSKATHLLLADIDSQVVKFNRINIALLQLSEGFTDYQNLRFAGTHEVWLNKIHANISMTTELNKILKDPETFIWWKMKVSQSQSFKEKNITLGLNSYINDPSKFHRIYKAAKEGRIQSIRLNLADPSQLISIAEEFHKEGLSISLLDIGSSWMPRYITNTGLLTVLTNLKSVFLENSILLLTKGDHIEGYWKYAAFSGAYLLNFDSKNITGEKIQKLFDKYDKPLLFLDSKMNIYKSKVLLWVERYLLPKKAPKCSRIFL